MRSDSGRLGERACECVRGEGADVLRIPRGWLSDGVSIGAKSASGNVPYLHRKEI